MLSRIWLQAHRLKPSEQLVHCYQATSENHAVHRVDMEKLRHVLWSRPTRLTGEFEWAVHRGCWVFLSGGTLELKPL